MSESNVYLLLLLTPLSVGAILAIANARQINTFVDRMMIWMNGKYSAATMNRGGFNKYVVVPILISILKLSGLANSITHTGLRSGIAAMATLYVLMAFGFLAYIAVSIALALLIFALALLVVGFILSQIGKDNDSGKDYSSMMGPRGSRATRNFLGFDLSNGTRVNERGQILKDGTFFDTPTGMKIDDEGRLVKEGTYFDTPTKTKIDKDGRIVEEGWLIDRPTGKRIDADGNVVEEGWLFDTKTGTRHIK